MSRANRYFLPDLVWHITHRCHKKEFLLKFVKDQECWLHWLQSITVVRSYIMYGVLRFLGGSKDG
ncbi:Transposase and inactivated derivatives [hydrothermal vent metagenome]|uniref:Transposase and inactivated derivatives n=1 Tax=hydrothermal vent metagenome TaxID=652676 RepID=A0A3B0ZVI0_9ZZZZ